MDTITLKVDGMTCGNCVKHITEAFEALDEIAEVMVTLDTEATSEVFLTLNDEITDAKIAEIIDDEGYILVHIER